MVRNAVALALLVSVVGIGAGACIEASASTQTAGAPSRPRTIAANTAAARTDASALLSRLRLPTGTRETSTEPSGDGRLLAQPGIGPPATPNAIDAHRLWVVPGGRVQTLASIAAHPPARSKLVSSGFGADHGVTTYEYKVFAWPPIRGVISMRWLVVEAVQLLHRLTALRADAQVVWVTPRAVSERIPSIAHLLRIEVRSSIAGNRPHQRPLSFSSIGRIDKLIALLNSLPVEQPGTRNCPADFGIRVRLTFFARPGAHPLAIASIDPQGCGDVGLTLEGQREPALASEGGLTRRSLIARIDRLLGVSLDVHP